MKADNVKTCEEKSGHQEEKKKKESIRKKVKTKPKGKKEGGKAGETSVEIQNDPAFLYASISASNTGTTTSTAQDSPVVVRCANSTTPTMFENAIEPAKINEKKFELKWKDSKEKLKADTKKSMTNGLKNPESLRNSKYRGACKVLWAIKASGSDIMENLVQSGDNEKLSSYFCGSSKVTTDEACELLGAAMVALYSHIMAIQDLQKEEDVKQLIQDSQSAQIALLDVILFVPDFLPKAWGGRETGLKISGNGEEANRIAGLIRDNEPEKKKKDPEKEGKKAKAASHLKKRNKFQSIRGEKQPAGKSDTKSKDK